MVDSHPSGSSLTIREMLLTRIVLEKEFLASDYAPNADRLYRVFRRLALVPSLKLRVAARAIGLILPPNSGSLLGIKPARQPRPLPPASPPEPIRP